MENPQKTSNQVMKIIEWIVYKITSGRFLLTIMAGVGLLMMESSILNVLAEKAKENNGLTATEILAFASTIFVVIQSVFMSYFNMKRDGESDLERRDRHPDDENRPNPPINKD